MKIPGSLSQNIIILTICVASCVRMQQLPISNAENIIIQIGKRLYLALPVDGTNKTYLLPIQITEPAETSTFTSELTSESQEQTPIKLISDQVGDVGNTGIKRLSNEGSQSRGSTVKDKNLESRSTVLREVLLPHWDIVNGQHSLNTNNMKVLSDVKSNDSGAITSTASSDNGLHKAEEALLLIAKGKQFQSSYMRHDLSLPHALRGIVRISPDMGKRILKNRLERTTTQNTANDTEKEGSHIFTMSSGHFTISKAKTPEGHWHIAIKSEAARETTDTKTDSATLTQVTKSNNSSISIKDG